MNRQPRILQLFNRYRFHGGEAQIISNMTPLLREFAEMTDCFFDSSDWIGPGAPVVWKQALLSLYNPASARSALAAHQLANADLWLAHNLLPVGSPSIYHAARRRRIPIVQHVQNYRPFSITGTYWIGDKLAGPTLRPVLFREAFSGAWNASVAQGLVMASAMRLLLSSGWLETVRAWVGVSRSTCAHLAEAGIPASRIHHVPPVWARSRETASFSDNYEGGFLYLGRLIPEKGIPVLLETWSILHRASGKSTPLLTICGAGPLEAAVSTACRTNPAIRFRGMVTGPDKERLLAACTALIVPSLWWDPNPTVVGEAYEHARPVLAASSGGLTDSVIDGRTGFLHPPGDCATLSDHVRHLADDPGLARQLGLAGNEYLAELTLPGRWQAGMRAVLEEVLDEQH